MPSLAEWSHFLVHVVLPLETREHCTLQRNATQFGQGIEAARNGAGSMFYEMYSGDLYVDSSTFVVV